MNSNIYKLYNIYKRNLELYSRGIRLEKKIFNPKKTIEKIQDTQTLSNIILIQPLKTKSH